MVVSVPPLVCWPDEYLTGRRKSFTFVEQAAKSFAGVLAAGRQPVDRVVQPYDLARQKLAVPVEWLRNATHIVHRPENDTRGPACERAWSTLLLSV
jgi:hypothetical protein